MDSNKLYNNLRSMPRSKRPINTIKEAVGCSLNMVRLVLKEGMYSPKYGAEIILEATRIWDKWQIEQVKKLVEIDEAAKETRKAIQKQIRRLSA